MAKVKVGLDTALEGKEPGCGSGCRDRPGTEGTTEGQTTQGREWCSIGQGSKLSSKQAWRFSPAPRGYVHLHSTIEFKQGKKFNPARRSDSRINSSRRITLLIFTQASSVGKAAIASLLTASQLLMPSSAFGVTSPNSTQLHSPPLFLFRNNGC